MNPLNSQNPGSISPTLQAGFVRSDPESTKKRLTT